MHTDTDALLESVRRWLRVVALALGFGVIALADVGYSVTNGVDGTLYAVVGIVGGLVATVAGLRLLADLLVVSGDDRPTRDSTD
ncbi:hypothetical protein [Salinigranum salinum]|uniref:hypothetical protein n=1 Tax=Salinigranum salinum TaxID=1364937 RepID=UPI00126049F0|nr:hypothetical protein [Salinigranum salinum]